ncbi:tripartite tricarboxylate transporter TctB family protein [Oscillospiraceae bacterium PP1C4]
MAELFKVNVVYSTSHLVVPKIIIGILIVLGSLIIITEGMARRKKGEPFFGIHVKLFIENYDKLKFWGTLVLFVSYILAMDIVGFIPASIVCIFLFNVLFCATKDKKSLLISFLISVVATIGIWYVFGVLFNVTLPSSMFS